jgi:hypothetical protein
MHRTCVKCGHDNPNATGDDAEACPNCGAIYAKAQASAARPITPAMQARQAAMSSSFGHSQPAFASSRLAGLNERENLRRAFVDEMRSASLYPTVRGFAQVGYIVGCVLAALLVLGSVIAVFTGSFLQMAVGLMLAAVIFLIARAVKETSLMLADMGDALVRMAWRGEEAQS